MSKHYRPWKIDEAQLLPATVQDYVPKEHLSRFIVALVREHLDLSEIEVRYNSRLGQPPFHPALMTALLLNGYASGTFSSRRMARACIERADFMMIVAGNAPDFRTISDFRKRHLQALKQLFVQVLKLCEAAGLAKLGHVALDGSKIKANASKHKAMSYGRMEARASELEAEVEKWLAAAEATDAAEDKLHGKDKAGGRAADLGGRQEAAGGQDPCRAGRAGGGGQGGCGGGDAAPGRSGREAHRGRPQEERLCT
jgi:transposase